MLHGNCHQIMALATHRMFRLWQQSSRSRAPCAVHIRLRFQLEHHLSLVCSDFSLAPRPIAMTLNTTIRHPITWPPRESHFLLPPRTIVQGFGHNKEIITILYEKNVEIRGATPKAASNPMESDDHRHITRAGLPYTTVGVFHV